MDIPFHYIHSIPFHILQKEDHELYFDIVYCMMVIFISM